LQSDGKTLKEISHKLINGVFPFKVEIDDSVSSKMSESYEKTTAGETQTIKAYLAGLAAQKNIILSHTAKGNLLFTKAKTDQKPFFHFDGGMSNIEMDLKFNGQGLHSRITIMKQASKDGGNAGQHEIRNSFVPFVFRPSVKTQNSGDDVDTAEAAQNALGAELKNIVLTIKVNYWEINGELLRPNTTLTVLNKELYIYKKVKWFVESVTFNGDEKQNTALLTCVLPEVYNGQMPEYFFEFDDSERGH
jgi:prophage tail gpP-like protein